MIRTVTHSPTAQLLLGLALFWLCAHPSTSWGEATGLIKAPSQYEVDPGHPLVIGIVPRRGRALTQRMYLPLQAYLEQVLNRKVTLETPETHQLFWDQLLQQRYDLAHLNPYQYVKAHRDLGYQAILMNEEFHTGSARGVIVVRNDSGITDLRQLQNKRIIVGEQGETPFSNITTRSLMSEQGLAHESYQTIKAPRNMDAVLAVFSGLVEAAGIGECVLHTESLRRQIDTRQLSIIASTPPMAHLPWAVHPRIGSSLKQQIASALTDLDKTPRGRELLQRMQLTQLIPVSDQDYNQHRQLIHQVTGEQF